MRLAAEACAVAMLCATAVWAQTPERSVAVSDLMGLGPAEVRGRLADVDPAWPIQPTFDVAAPDGLLSFISAADLMADPVLANVTAVFRTYGDPGPWQPYVSCQTKFQRDAGQPMRGGGVVLAFRNGRLESALAPPPSDFIARSAISPEAIRALQIHPPPSPFIGRPGDLPLQDGAAFLSRWDRAPLAKGDRLSVACAPAKAPTPIPHAPKKGLDARDMQGLALLPFAVGLPGMNHRREEARVEGHTLLQSLHVGDSLPAPADRFASQHPGVHAFASGPDYAVLAIDLGGYPTRNLSNFRDFALVGARNGRIEWIAPPTLFGPLPSLLCLDDKGVAGTPRRGCHGYGEFLP
jgi:hypothetical protein